MGVEDTKVFPIVLLGNKIDLEEVLPFHFHLSLLPPFRLQMYRERYCRRRWNSGVRNEGTCPTSKPRLSSYLLLRLTSSASLLPLPCDIVSPIFLSCSLLLFYCNLLPFIKGSGTEEPFAELVRIVLQQGRGKVMTYPLLLLFLSSSFSLSSLLSFPLYFPHSSLPFSLS